MSFGGPPPPPGQPPYGQPPGGAPPGGGYPPPGGYTPGAGFPPGGGAPPGGGYPPGGYPPPPGGGQPLYAGAGPQQPKKGGNKGCWIALGIVGGLGLITCGIVGYIVWRVSEDPDVKKALSVAAGGLELINDAQKAEGTSELKSMGCQQAMVFDVDKLLDLAEKTTNDKKFKRPKVEVEKLVMCQNAKKDITCEDVAKEYVDAAEPDDDFGVMVNSTNASNNCSERYDEDGKKLGTFSGNVPIPTGK